MVVLEKISRPEINNPSYFAVKSIPFGDYTLIKYPENQLNEALQLLVKTFPQHYIETTIVNLEPPLIEGFITTKTGFLVQIDIKQWRKSHIWEDAYERNIKKALNFGLEVKISERKESIEKFYLLHEKLRIHKFKKLPQPIRFFVMIYEKFIKKGAGFFLEVWNKNQIVASWIILKHNHILYYKFGTSDLNSLYMRPNDLLFRSLMQYGSDNGFTTVDLGFSGASKSYEGLLRFKSKEGGDKMPIYRIEQYPKIFDMALAEKRNGYLKGITEKALASGNLSVIRETSNRYYGMFA